MGDDWVEEITVRWPGDVVTFDDLEEIRIAGISRYERNASKFVRSRIRHVVLEREPDNKHDPNAVAVFGMWEGGDGYAEEGRWATYRGRRPPSSRSRSTEVCSSTRQS